MLTECLELLGDNRNYRLTWSAQIVSEVGDNLNNIAVFALAMALTHSGLVVTGILLARAVPAITMAPVAGVLLDRFDRKQIMIASDLVRALVAFAFMFVSKAHYIWLFYLLSALLMAASPFFTAGRLAILPTLVDVKKIHAANSITQITQWMTLTIGSFLGATILVIGYKWVFALNALSFLCSAERVWRLRAPTASGFRVDSRGSTRAKAVHPWREYRDGLRYMCSVPLVFGIALLSVGWATGGGAAQILFTLFGAVVFKRGGAGIGMIWGCAGLGALAGGVFANWLGKWLSFEAYKITIFVDYIGYGITYILFCRAERFGLALFFIFLSRAVMAISSILNYTYLLRTIPDLYRGRVFATVEGLMWTMMLASMMTAGVASMHHGPRLIGVVSGLMSSSTAILWGWANWAGRLPPPRTLMGRHS